MASYEDRVADVLELVLSWDLPDEALGQALADEAVLLAGEGPDDR